VTVLDYLLDGLAAELELVRELGTRTVEVDRALFAVERAGRAARSRCRACGCACGRET